MTPLDQYAAHPKDTEQKRSQKGERWQVPACRTIAETEPANACVLMAASLVTSNDRV